MKNSRGNGALGFVIGASVGALVGLVFIYTSLWLTLVGAVIGGLIGLRAGSSGTKTGRAMDEAGLCTLGCLWRLVELWISTGCIGCTFVATVLIGFMCLCAIFVCRGPLAASHYRRASFPVIRAAPIREGARGRRLQPLRAS